ncbi:DUF5666 domain-containing protein [Methylocystis parvus]|uniref:Uncharacterized protein n=1 Tax=Methylocystis parvus TaxID=134 RepID=A0A6B8M643_9HYPH|nr:DUF5666 domain-containing protein [Methylocystis parvus]QGM98361.1 hypothetical protein F7D14_13320 [Methylocystis parvus]WBK01311.1 DUF5666 domain-containing protein [Methylocystis parvus OBBP]
MTHPVRPTRRQFGALLFALLSTASRRAFAAGGNPKDNGLGGTGYISPMPDPDNGLGGTGVVGVIRGFGSVIVNGLRISYPSNAEVTIDGEPANPAAMRIGHVVSLVARRENGAYSTKKLDILREAVGAIEFVSDRKMRVLGQKIELGRNVKSDGLAVGRLVAVSGLRLPDQTIVASLVEPVAPGAAQLLGTVTRAKDGGLEIGGQRLEGVAESMLGRRVLLRGAQRGATLDASHVADAPWLPRGAERFVAETYLERYGSTVTTASGLDLGDANGMSFRGVVRAVVSFELDPAGGWSVQSFEPTESLGAHGAAGPRRMEQEAPKAAPDQTPPPSPGGGGTGFSLPGAPAEPGGFGPGGGFGLPDPGGPGGFGGPGDMGPGGPGPGGPGPGGMGPGGMFHPPGMRRR